jgi:hypothetical protein
MELGFLLVLATAVGGATVGGLVHTWLLHRRVLRLEYRANDIEDRLLTLRNREKVEKRWTREDQFKTELMKLAGTGSSVRPQHTRYANDPIEPEL